jgi:hypothetical protein
MLSPFFSEHQTMLCCAIEARVGVFTLHFPLFHSYIIRQHVQTCVPSRNNECLVDHIP